MLSVANRVTILGRPVCRHCKLRPACRPKKLCYRCFHTPKVRLKYGLKECDVEIDDYIHKGKVDKSKPLDKHPTDAPPGSEEKVEVLIDRANRGVALWHPLDAGMHEYYDRSQGRTWWLD
jgi:hypothetical protein